MLKAFCLIGVFFYLATNLLAMGSLKIEGNTLKKSVYNCVIRSFAQDNQARLWVGTFGAGLWVIMGDNDQEWRHFTKTPNGLPDDRISKLLVKEKELYIATAGGGVCSLNLDDLSWKPISLDLAKPVCHFHSLSFIDNDRMLLGSVGEGLFVRAKNRWSRFTEMEGLPNDWVNDSLVASEGAWIATFCGLAFFDTDHFAFVEYPQGEWQDGNINVLALFKENLYLGTGSGGLIMRSAASEAYQKIIYKRVGRIPSQVFALQARENKLWVGTDDGLYSLENPDSVKKILGPWPEETSIKSLGLYKNSLVAGTGRGEIYFLETNGNWSKMVSLANNTVSSQ